MENSETEVAKGIHPLYETFPNFDRLPSEFQLDTSLIAGIKNIRRLTDRQKVEVGAVFLRDGKGDLSTQITGGDNPNYVSSNLRILGDSNIGFYLKASKQEYAELKNAIFVTSQDLAQRYKFFFDSLIKDGSQVLFDQQILAFLHSHPSGNLPSSGDFSHTIFHAPGLPDKEIVITSEWVHFLIATNKTPNLFDGLDDPLNYSLRREIEEDEIVKHISAIYEKDDQGDPLNKLRNSVRSKMLQDNCHQYNVAYYTLRNTEDVAKRIV